MMRKPVPFLLFLIIVLIVGGIVYELKLQKQANTSTASTKIASQTNADGNKGVVDYAIEMSNYKFTPNLIEIEPGQELQVKIKNTQGGHDFVVPGLNIKSKFMSSGEEETVTIKAPLDSLGKTYEFYCTPHKGIGMTGTIKVRQV